MKLLAVCVAVVLAVVLVSQAAFVDAHAIDKRVSISVAKRRNNKT